MTTLAQPPAPPASRRPRGENVAATRARLRRLIATIEARSPLPAKPPADDQPPVESPEDYRDLLATAERRETDSGPFTFREVTYSLTHEAGHQSLGDILQLSTDTLTLLAPEESLEDATLSDLYFLDIETTGLGGAGAIAFLVAAARFEVDDAGAPTSLVLAQYLAESPPEEAGVLDALIEDARFRDDPVLVTYNGRTFDAPLLDERATMHRRRAGFGGLRQLDLLRPARTAYRGLLPNCKLGTLEQHVLGMTRPSEDIPGADVPRWYFRFLRSGDHRMLNPIVEHNELDVIGMVGLLAWHAAYLDSARAPAPRDALGLGRLLAARGLDERATPHLTRATEPLPGAAAAPATTDSGANRVTGSPPRPPRPAAPLAQAGATVYEPRARQIIDQVDARAIREEALLRLAALHKRNGARDRAVPLWHAALSIPARAPLEPLIQLAMYYEHERHDFAQAIVHAEQAAAHASAWLRRDDPMRAARLLEAIDHRLARLHSRAERAGRTS